MKLHNFTISVPAWSCGNLGLGYAKVLAYRVEVHEHPHRDKRVQKEPRYDPDDPSTRAEWARPARNPVQYQGRVGGDGGREGKAKSLFGAI